MANEYGPGPSREELLNSDFYEKVEADAYEFLKGSSDETYPAKTAFRKKFLTYTIPVEEEKPDDA